MKMMLAGIALAGMMIALAAWAGDELARGEGAAQDTVSIGVDADPTGNTATSLGPIDSCVSVSTGDTFQVDLFVTDVTDLLAWETYFVYDMSVINIVSQDVMLFQAANAGSKVFDVSEGLPDIDGWYSVAAVDLAQPPAPDNGSGVLARLTLKAVGAGVSPVSLSPIDVNSDGTMDLGPTLKNIEAEPIADLDDDGFFDGGISNAQIAVDTTCPGGTASPVARASPAIETPGNSPTAETPAVATPAQLATPSPASPTPVGPSPADNEGSAWTGDPAIIGYIVGGLAAVLLSGAALLAIRRSRAR
jgi:hypothetical protein